MNYAEQAHVWWERQVMDWEIEDAIYDHNEDYQEYITEIVECPCGYHCPRYEMEDHWCDDLEKMLNAIHTPKR